jgi:TetR/AcrR family transcriptional regulator, transcriptional repressor for nem operon
MRRAGGKKAETHQRIVAAAAAAIRRHGYDGVSVANVMKEAGLTHGGFYAHFPSREAMLAEAMERAGADSLEALARAAEARASQDALEALVTSYLSDRHLDNADQGCTFAALGSESRRQSPQVRKAASRRIREMADLIARHLPGWGQSSHHDEALGVMSTLVGALTIARLTDDPRLSRAVRKGAARLIRRGVQQG